MTMKIPCSFFVFQSNDVTMTDQFWWPSEIVRVVRSLDQPQVVVIFVQIGCNLLLVSSNPFWVKVPVRVQIPSCYSQILHGYDRAICQILWHGGVVQIVSN